MIKRLEEMDVQRASLSSEVGRPGGKIEPQAESTYTNCMEKI